MVSYLNIAVKLAIIGFGYVSLLFNSPSFAAEKLLTINLKTEKNQSFVSFIKKAELAAIDSINQEFNRLSTITEIGITVVGESNGQAVPLLFTRVSRQNWQAQPKIQSWTNYFSKASTLLGFNLPQKPKFTAFNSSINIRAKESDPGFRDD